MPPCPQQIRPLTCRLTCYSCRLHAKVLLNEQIPVFGRLLCDAYIAVLCRLRIALWPWCCMGRKVVLTRTPMKTEMRAKVNRRAVLFMLLLLDEPSHLLHLNALKLGCGLQVLVSYLHSRSGAVFRPPSVDRCKRNAGACSSAAKRVFSFAASSTSRSFALDARSR